MRAACKLDGCSRPTYARNLCTGHHARLMKYGDPNAGPQLKRIFRVEETIEEIEWFKSFGVHPAQIATQLGLKISSLEKMCARAGRPDLAALFSQARERDWAREYLERRGRAAS